MGAQEQKAFLKAARELAHLSELLEVAQASNVQDARPVGGEEAAPVGNEHPATPAGLQVGGVTLRSIESEGPPDAAEGFPDFFDGLIFTLKRHRANAMEAFRAALGDLTVAEAARLTFGPGGN